MGISVQFLLGAFFIFFAVLLIAGNSVVIVCKTETDNTDWTVYIVKKDGWSLHFIVKWWFISMIRFYKNKYKRF